MRKRSKTWDLVDTFKKNVLWITGWKRIILPPYFFLKKGVRKDMKLVIAEKPSVALSIAKVLGANDKKDGYVEGNGYKVS